MSLPPLVSNTFPSPALLFLRSVCVFLDEGVSLSLCGPHSLHAALVTSCQRSLQPGMQMSVDPRLHFIIINIRLLGPAASVKPGAIQMKKPGIIQAIRRTPDVNLYRKTGTTLIYNYVSTDQCVFTIIITPQEL